MLLLSCVPLFETPKSRYPALQVDSLPAKPQEKPKNTGVIQHVSCIAGRFFTPEPLGKPPGPMAGRGGELTGLGLARHSVSREVPRFILKFETVFGKLRIPSTWSSPWSNRHLLSEWRESSHSLGRGGSKESSPGTETSKSAAGQSTEHVIRDGGKRGDQEDPKWER